MMMNRIVNPKGYVIRHKTQLVGFPHDNKHYVVGFTNVVLARTLQYTMHPQPIFKLERNHVIDISDAVDTALNDMFKIAPSMDVKEKGRITVDVGSTLWINKMSHPGGVWDPMNEGGFSLHTVDCEYLYMLPFSSNVGVVFPRELTSETAQHLVFDCEVIDPVCSTGHFRKSLEMF
jgi:hypothetical protein